MITIAINKEDEPYLPAIPFKILKHDAMSNVIVMFNPNDLFNQALADNKQNRVIRMFPDNTLKTA